MQWRATWGYEGANAPTFSQDGARDLKIDETIIGGRG